MPSRAYPVETENETGWSDWIRPRPGYRMACCDCGLVHEMEMSVDDDGRPVFRARRLSRHTGQLRRQMTRRGEGSSAALQARTEILTQYPGGPTDEPS